MYHIRDKKAQDLRWLQFSSFCDKLNREEFDMLDEYLFSLLTPKMEPNNPLQFWMKITGAITPGFHTETAEYDEDDWNGKDDKFLDKRMSVEGNHWHD